MISWPTLKYVVVGTLQDCWRYERTAAIKVLTSPLRHAWKRMSQDMFCKVCGESVGHDFDVPDSVWEASCRHYGSKMHGHVLCLNCMARAHGMRMWEVRLVPEGEDCFFSKPTKKDKIKSFLSDLFSE